MRAGHKREAECRFGSRPLCTSLDSLAGSPPGRAIFLISMVLRSNPWVISLVPPAQATDIANVALFPTCPPVFEFPRTRLVFAYSKWPRHRVKPRKWNITKCERRSIATRYLAPCFYRGGGVGGLERGYSGPYVRFRNCRKPAEILVRQESLTRCVSRPLLSSHSTHVRAAPAPSPRRHLALLWGGVSFVPTELPSKSHMSCILLQRFQRTL